MSDERAVSELAGYIGRDDAGGLKAFLADYGLDGTLALPLDDRGRNALDMAVKVGSEACAVALLDGGADPDRRTAEGMSPLDYAVVTGQIGMARLLVERGAEVNRGDGEGVTPILRAVFAMDIDLARLLLAAGADADAKPPGRETSARGLALNMKGEWPSLFGG